MTAAEDLGKIIAELQRKVEILERASQAQHSTIETDGGTVALGDAAGTAVETAAALPGLEQQAGTAQATADSVAILADDWDADLNAHLEAAAAELDDARAALEDSQTDIEDAFGQTVDGLSEDVETAITAAGGAASLASVAKDAADQATQAAADANGLASTAKTAADSANSAALAASGLASSKGEVIVQVSAPTGSRANPANLWIDSTLDASGKPKNTPNRYNTSTSKWEPITDQKVIDAAAAAAAANALASSASAAASEADTKARNAQTAANSAQTTANNAGQAAAAAQTTADTAKTNASTAQIAADAARARADAAMAAAVNVIRDPSFEDPTLWADLPARFSISTDQKRSGVRSLKAVASSTVAAVYLASNVPVLPGQTWRVRAARLTTQDYNGTGNNGKIRLGDQSGGLLNNVSWNTSTSWGQVAEMIYTVPSSGVTALNLTASADHTTGALWVDDVELVNITDAKAAADAAKQAQSTADAAKTNAANAQSAADQAKSAADAAQATATQAKTDAANAKTVADNANSQALAAAGIANGKGKVIVQVSAPTGANAVAENLWIDISNGADGKPKNAPNRWNPSTSKWEVITDKAATDAAAAAAAAQQAATAAANAAKAAQATADGKPLILFSSTAGPSGTAPTGSIWFLWDSGKNVAGQWLQSGTLASPVWTPQQIRSEVIANLDVAKLTAGSAAIAELVAQKIAASTANFQTVNVSNLFVTSGATLSQAVIDFLFANVVQAKKITAGMIDVESLNGVTLTGTVLRSAATGRRLEIQKTEIVFYSDNTLAGSIRGDFAPAPYSNSLILRVGEALSTGSLEPQGQSSDPDFFQTTLFNLGDFNNQGSIRASRGGARPNNKVAQVISDQFALEWGSPLDNTGAGRRRRIFATAEMTSGRVTIDADDYLVAGKSIVESDTGWRAVPNVPSAINSFAYYRVIGNRVYLRGSFQRPNQAQFVNGYTPVGTLPAGARPSQYMRAALSMYNGITGNLIIGTDGYMQVGASTGATADTVYVGGITFLND